MAGLHLLPARFTRWTSVCVCFGLLFSAIAGIPFQAASSEESSRVRPQEQDANQRRVAPLPSRTGPPAANLPNLDEVKHRQVPVPRAAAFDDSFTTQAVGVAEWQASWRSFATARATNASGNAERIANSDSCADAEV
ncbi:MAG: hypothetical protein WAM70_19975 [Pyrinomonadaceae bacterium]